MTHTTLITGGSEGIGFALARVFAHHGHNIILVARREELLQRSVTELQQTYGVECEYIVSDLSDIDSAEKLYGELKRRGHTVGILINNAGFGTWGKYWEIGADRSQREMQLNMVSLSLLTKLILNDMIKQQQGKIAHIASTAAFQPGPLMSVYYATKAFVVSFSEALAQEVMGTGVSVTVICPGPTATGFQQHAGMANMHLLKKYFLMDAATVAEKAYRGIVAGKRMVIPGILNKIVASTAPLLPKRFVLPVVLSLHKRRG